MNSGQVTGQEPNKSKDKLREEIVEEISSMIDIAETADRILSLIAPELDAARLWRRVKEIADSRPPCKCPLWKEGACNLEYGGCIFRDVVEALAANVKCLYTDYICPNDPECNPSTDCLGCGNRKEPT